MVNLKSCDLTRFVSYFFFPPFLYILFSSLRLHAALFFCIKIITRAPEHLKQNEKLFSGVKLSSEQRKSHFMPPINCRFKIVVDFVQHFSSNINVNLFI